MSVGERTEGEGALLREVKDGVAVLTLNRPEKRNALNHAVVEDLRSELAELEGAEDVRVVLLRGAGRDFCSGMDLAQLATMTEAGAEASLSDARALGSLFVAMRRHPRPVVAAVHGRALAGGAGLAAACDLVLAHHEAELGFTEVHLGFVPAMVMAILRRKVTEARAFELLTRGDRIDADEAHRLGVVNRVFHEDVEEFGGEALAYARELAERPASAVELTKRLLYGIDGVAFEDAVARGAEVNTLARFTEACREGVRRFLERKRTR